MTVPPSGEQFEITYGEQSATVVEVGGGVRAYRVGRRDVLHPYDVDAMCDGAHGAPLIPWPNRLADGKYSFADANLQVALTEPDKHNAIHGFLRWRPWTCAERSADRVVMSSRLYPLMGYPFTLDVSVDYRLSDDGLIVATTATNIGAEAAPYACGQHPYLSPGAGTIDACTLQFAADTRIDTDSGRQLPIETESVSGTRFDFAKPGQLGELAIDYAFTDLARDADGRSWCRLTGQDGRTAEIWIDDTYPYLELYTADTLSEDRRRRGLGVEPMTAPPNAFASGTDVASLQPDESVSNTWGCRLT
ncbi:MAG: aldose 1-epimerase family protein [Nocardioidaceae bacterium]